MLPSDFPRPEKHPFDADPLTRGATCRECGEAFDFGWLHPTELPEIPDDPRPQFCARCPHVEHAGACPDALPAFPRDKPCPCSGLEAVA